LPGELGRVADRESANLLAVDDQVFGVVLDFALEAAMVAVVLEQRGQHLVVGEIVDGNDLELARAGMQQAKSKAADAAKSVNSDSNGHGFNLRQHLKFRSSPAAAIEPLRGGWVNEPNSKLYRWRRMVTT